MHIIFYAIANNKFKIFLSSSPIIPWPLFQRSPKLLVFDKTLNPSTFSLFVNFDDKSTKLEMLLLSSRSQINCQVSETIAIPQTLPIKTCKVCTCLTDVIFANSRTEERCFYEGLSYNTWRRVFRAFRQCAATTAST